MTRAAALRRLPLAVPWLPICVLTFFSRAISPSRRASEMVRVSGFWQKQCLPIRIAIAATAACVWSGVLTVTASIDLPSLSSRTRKSVNFAALG